MRIQCTTERHFWNNAPDTYMGRAIVFEHGVRVWSVGTKIDRPTKADAMADAKNLKAELLEQAGL